MITGKIESVYLNENLKTHFSFLESQIQSAPDGGPFLCGRHLTAADILMSFPLVAVSGRSTISRQQYPAVFAYVDRLKEADGYQKAVAKILEVDGSFQDV
jgi:glutathione S-transferase